MIVMTCYSLYSRTQDICILNYVSDTYSMVSQGIDWLSIYYIMDHKLNINCMQETCDML